MIINSKYNQRIKNYSTSPQKNPEILSCFSNTSKKIAPYTNFISKNSWINPSLIPNQPKKAKKLSSSLQARISLLTPEDESILNEIQKVVPKAPIFNSPKPFTNSSLKTPSNQSIYSKTEELQIKLKSWKEKRKKLESRYTLLLQDLTITQENQEKVLENLRLKLDTQSSFQS